MKTFMREYLFSGLAVFAFLLLLEAASRTGFSNSALLPSPTEIFKTFYILQEDYKTAFLSTFINVILGLGSSILGGVLIAFLCGLYKPFEKAIFPFAIFFQTVPIIAIAPLLVIYLGFGRPTVVASSCIVSIFPVIANLILGLQNTPPHLMDLFRIQKATRIQTLIKLKLPSSYSFILSGLQIASGLAIIGAVAGEFVAGGGLGSLIDTAKTQQRVDIVYGAILLLSAMGLGFIAFWRMLSYLILRQRPFVVFLKE